MNYELLIAGVTLFITIVANIVVIAFFAGQLKANQVHQKETFKLIQTHFEESLKLIKAEFQQNFERLEKKQDKHNSVIERQFRLEGVVNVLNEKVEVANHRILDLEELTK